MGGNFDTIFRQWGTNNYLAYGGYLILRYGGKIVGLAEIKNKTIIIFLVFGMNRTVF